MRIKTLNKRERRIDRLQNLAIVLLTLSALALFAGLPLFGPLSDRSLIELAQESARGEAIRPEAAATASSVPVFPVRMVYTNNFARVGADALTTLSDEFEHAGTFLGEAVGSANRARPVGEAEFLHALQDEGLYFDFTEAVPAGILSSLLGVSVPEQELPDVRRMLLSCADPETTALYAQDGAGRSWRFSTAVSPAALSDFLASRSGSNADFAFLLGEDCAALSPYTLVLSEPAARGVLSAAPISGGEELLLRRAEFNAHTENRFTETSGTVIIREGSSALYLRPNGTVEYQGAAAEPGSAYFVPAAEPGAPTLAEAASAAQRLMSALLQDLLGDASLCFGAAAANEDGSVEISFDLLADGTPIRRSDGSHAASVTVEGQSVTAFVCRARCYTKAEDAALLLPFAQAAAIAHVWNGAELLIAYVDTSAEAVQPVWIAE